MAGILSRERSPADRSALVPTLASQRRSARYGWEQRLPDILKNIVLERRQVGVFKVDPAKTEQDLVE